MNFKRNTPRKLSDEMSKEYTINPGDITIKFSALEDRIVRVTDKVTDKLNLLAIDPAYTTTFIYRNFIFEP